MRIFVLGLAFVFGLSVTPMFAGQGSDRTRIAQQALKDKGFDPGPIDGIEGPKTDEAIRKYQKENNLAVDGRLNADVLNSLGLHGHTAGGRFEKAGSNLTNSYGSGADKIGNAGQKVGKDVKTGEYANAPVDLGKGVVKGVTKMGKGTGKAAVNAYKGAKEAVTPK